MKQYLECGLIQNTHGCHGGVRAASYADSPSVLAGLKIVYLEEGGVYTPLHVAAASLQGDRVLFTFREVESMEAAELLKNRTIYALREDIPLRDGAYFLADLEGLPLMDADSGERLGTVLEMREVGGRNLLAVRVPAGERMIPCVPKFLRKVDVESGVYIRPIPGLLDEI